MPETDKEDKVDFDLTGADLAIVPPDLLASRQRPRTGRSPAERTKQQQVIDKLVTQAHEAWIKAGRPKEFSKSRGGLVTVPPAQVANVEKAIRKAGTYLNLSIRFGQYTDVEGNPVLDETGRCQVVFRASDRPVKAESE